MIIPRIDIPCFAETYARSVADAVNRSNLDLAGDVDRLIELGRQSSLFGKLAIGGGSKECIAELETIATVLGGSVDLLIEWKAAAGLDEASLLKLLNAGASTVYSSEVRESPFPAIPADRWLSLLPEQIMSTTEEVRNVAYWIELQLKELDALVDAQILLREPKLVVEFLEGILISDRTDGLWPTVIVDELGTALGLAYSNSASLLDALTHRRGTYWSRSRNGLWIKGKESGATQGLLGIRWDCDRDTLRFQFTQDSPGFCHLKTHSCFGYERGIATILERLRERATGDDLQSFTYKLINDPNMLKAKLLEEAGELADARDKEHIVFEAADVLYFTLIKLLASGSELHEVYQELARRMNRVVRRANKLEQ